MPCESAENHVQVQTRPTPWLNVNLLYYDRSVTDSLKEVSLHPFVLICIPVHSQDSQLGKVRGLTASEQAQRALIRQCLLCHVLFQETILIMRLGIFSRFPWTVIRRWLSLSFG